MREDDRRLKELSTTTMPLTVPSEQAVTPTTPKGASGMKLEFVYLLTLTEPRTSAWQLAGVFLDPSAATRAKEYLVEQGMDEDLIDIDYAPIGVVNTFGVDESYVPGPVH